MSYTLCPWDGWFKYVWDAEGPVWKVYKPYEPPRLSVIPADIGQTLASLAGYESQILVLHRRWFRYGMAEEKTAVYVADGDTRLDEWFAMYQVADRLIRLLHKAFIETGRRVW